MTFQLGEMLTRRDIADRLGGLGTGPLPAKEGHVACGLFDLGSAVTHMSGNIDVFVKSIPKPAKSLVEAIPVFLKVSTQQFRYVGEYKLATIASAKREIDKARLDLGREDIGAILHFTPTHPLKLVPGRKAK